MRGMPRLITAVFGILISGFACAQSPGNFVSANNYFDDGRKGTFSAENRRSGDLVLGLVEDYTGEYVTYRKITTKDDGTPIKDNDIVKGKGIYRKKGAEFYRMNIEGPINIRWYGAISDGITDNSESITEALAASPFIKFPAGNFAISSPILINSTVQIVGEGFLLSKLTCLDKNMSAFVLGSNTAVSNISLLSLSNFTINKGKYGISAVRETGSKLTIERSKVKNINFEEQSVAGIYMRGKNVLFLVNTLQENVFRYCGTGIHLDNIFSANLNHLQLNRFEGTIGGVKISTTNNELSQLTVQKNRFEAIVAKQSIGSPISITGGNQNVSISDNYFEDVPDPVIHIDAANSISIALSISNNQFSANIKGVIMIKLTSQVKAPYIVSNVFRPGQAGTKLDFSSFVSEPIIQGNYGDVSFVSYPVPYASFQKGNVQKRVKSEYFKKNVKHSGNFTFDIQLPSSGVFNVTVALAEDGDFSLGGVASYKVGWFKADAPLLFSLSSFSKYNPNTISIYLSGPTANGMVSVNVQKADSRQRIASCYYSINDEINTDLANFQDE
jgi:hypothetical protein